MKKEPNDNGKPMCCAPGDISGCLIETIEEENETPSDVDLPEKSRETDETKKKGKAQSVAAE